MVTKKQAVKTVRFSGADRNIERQVVLPNMRQSKTVRIKTKDMNKIIQSLRGMKTISNLELRFEM